MTCAVVSYASLYYAADPHGHLEEPGVGIDVLMFSELVNPRTA